MAEHPAWQTGAAEVCSPGYVLWDPPLPQDAVYRVTPWYDRPVPLLDYGTQVTVIATPDGGWKFLGWGGTMGSTESPFTFELTQDCNLEAQFVPEQAPAETYSPVQRVGFVSVWASRYRVQGRMPLPRRYRRQRWRTRLKG